MDFVSAWKASAIVLTGGFGILGLFKDKDSHKVTVPGYISLVGIIVSTLFGVAAQLKESSDAEKAKAVIAGLNAQFCPASDAAVPRFTYASAAELDGQYVTEQIGILQRP
jgi:hypothetical protein